ncbi:hypothetical protein SDC9_194949 [bioreactor metagenome]|uniref:DUF2922 domain-containing protein n=1 Tax=bioreactor metagenome TaxID=1076179 RepID=A0A645I7M8_9ZZZZ
MTKTLEMVFRNQEGKETVVSLADPRDNLTKAEVDTVMQDIVAKNIFSTKGGDLVQLVDARIRTRDSVALV